METADTFEAVPLSWDNDSKTLSAALSTPPPAALAAELAALNALHARTAAEPTPVLPPPVPLNPKRTAQVAKLREAGNNDLRRGVLAQAARLHGLALDMALARPPWEPAALARDEVALCALGRAQTYLAAAAWPLALGDAKLSIEYKRVGNASAWWRGGKAMLEMGRLDDAERWLVEALAVEPGDSELTALRDEVRRAARDRKA